MTKEEKFLIDNKIYNTLTNRHELNHKKWVYVSDVLKIWEAQREKYNQAFHEDAQGKTSSHL